MEKNNGKIAIAIVAMFVVALSIVGVTYAYFTATVTGNSNQSVEVKAGELSIVYNNGTSLYARNVVPGWTSDGAHYYDAKYSSTDSNSDGVYEIVATNTTAHSTKSDGTEPGAADGITDRAVFTVSNSANNDGDNSFIIRLKNITNGITDTDDQKRLWVTLYKGEGEDETVVWSGNLVAGTGSQSQVIVPAAETIGKNDDPINYSVALTYQNLTNGVQSSKNVTIDADVEVIGVVNNGTNWVDADNNIITFATANTTVPALEVTAE